MVKIIMVGVIGIGVLFGIASRFVFKKTDNIVEETVEQIIEKKTGWDIDLSPDTPDKKDKIKYVDEVVDIIDSVKERVLKDEHSK